MKNIKLFIITSDKIVDNYSILSYKSFSNSELLNDLYDGLTNINYNEYTDLDVKTDSQGINEITDILMKINDNNSVFLTIYKYIDFLVIRKIVKLLKLNPNEIFSIHIEHKNNKIFSIDFNENYKMINKPNVDFYNNLDNILSELI